MDKTRMVSVELALHWQCRHARHLDRSFFDRVSLWRDVFPGDLGARLIRSRAGEPVSCSMSPGELVEIHESQQVRTLSPAQFRPPRQELAGLKPRIGRFYPRNFLDVPDYFPEDLRPFRCLAADPERLVVDFNHPFAGYTANVEARIVEELEQKEERGGRCNDIPADLTSNGPGMQAALENGEIDFFGGDPFARIDTRPDPGFYLEPRLVQHLDRVALSEVTGIYRDFLRPGMRVLDLMSSWVSHLPEETSNLDVVGLGLNREELERNPVLRERVIHDVNANSRLPVENHAFDAAVCTVSVEYLTRPVELFREVARVLRPGAPFVVTFSDRWFPTKVIALWMELHPFERLSLVTDYFRRAGGFTDLATVSIRGRPRPADDPHAAQRSQADPVFAVSGRRGAS